MNDFFLFLLNYLLLLKVHPTTSIHSIIPIFFFSISFLSPNSNDGSYSSAHIIFPCCCPFSVSHRCLLFCGQVIVRMFPLFDDYNNFNACRLIETLLIYKEFWKRTIISKEKKKKLLWIIICFLCLSFHLPFTPPLM